MKRLKILVVAVAVILVVIVNLFFLFQKPSAYQPREEDSFSERNVVQMQVDTLQKLIKGPYPKALVKIGSKMDIVISEGNLNNFYNTNPELLKVKDKGFSIEHQSGSLKASFSVTVLNGITYASVPADVVYKLAERNLD